MMTYALSITRQTKLRAVVAMAPANTNLPGEPTDTNAAPIAYMGTTGMSDTTCAWVISDANKTGGKYCALQHAQDNGCTIPAGNNIPTTTVGSKKYLCYDFAGCWAGYPVKVCTFDGPHIPSSVDDETSTGDDGLKPSFHWRGSSSRSSEQASAGDDRQRDRETSRTERTPQGRSTERVTAWRDA